MHNNTFQISQSGENSLGWSLSGSQQYTWQFDLRVGGLSVKCIFGECDLKSGVTSTTHTVCDIVRKE